jgi:septal ring factor EnvC (AmiA/AmiB activator)
MNKRAELQIQKIEKENEQISKEISDLKNENRAFVKSSIALTRRINQLENERENFETELKENSKFIDLLIASLILLHPIQQCNGSINYKWQWPRTRADMTCLLEAKG